MYSLSVLVDNDFFIILAHQCIDSLIYNFHGETILKYIYIFKKSKRMAANMQLPFTSEEESRMKIGLLRKVSRQSNIRLFADVRKERYQRD